MKFPRVHVFVDSNCPALLSGKISSWVAPSKLVAMLSPKNTQFSPQGASAASALRWWCSCHEPKTPEVQIVIEGNLMTGLLVGLGDHIRDIYYFKDKEAMNKVEAFERLYGHYRAFQRLICEAEKSFEALDAELSKIDPEFEALDLCGSIEIVAELDLGDSPSIPGVLIELAERYADELAPAKNQERRAA